MTYTEQAKQYYRDILDKKILQGKYTILQARKYFDYFDTYGDQYDEKMVNLFFEFHKDLKHPELGKPLEFLPWMVAILSFIVGFHKLIRTYYLEVQRKNSKTTSILVPLALFELFCKRGSETHVISGDDSQQGACYRQIRDIIEANYLKKYLKFKGTEIRLSNGSTMFSHSSASQKLDAYRNSLTLLDEFHAYKTNAPITASRYGGAQRDESLVAITTSAGISKTGAGYAERLNAQQYLESDEIKQSYFAIIYAIDETDQWDDPSIWLKASPSLGPITKIQAMKDDLEDAKKDPNKLLDFKAKRLGIYQNASTQRWLTDEQQELIHTAEDIDVSKDPFVITFDLSEVSDFTVVTQTWRHLINDQPIFIQKHKYFLPEYQIYDIYAVSQKNVNKLLPLWQEENRIELTPGSTVNYLIVSDYIQSLIEPNLRLVGYDSWHASSIVERLEKNKRIPLISLKQNGMALSEPIKEFEKAIMDGTIYLKEEDPIFRWMLSNATMKQSTSGIKKIYKPEKQNVDKIDAVITSLMGHTLACNPLVARPRISQRSLIL